MQQTISNEAILHVSNLHLVDECAFSRDIYVID